MPAGQILREVELILGVQRVIEKADRGEVVSADQARRLLREWALRS